MAEEDRDRRKYEQRDSARGTRAGQAGHEPSGRGSTRRRDIVKNGLREEPAGKKSMVVPVLGTLWNALMLCAWISATVMGIVSSLSPTEAFQNQPLWFKLLESIGVITVCGGLFLLPLTYGRPYKKFFPKLAAIPRIKLLAYCWIIAAVVLLAIFAVYATQFANI
ncbi:MAG: hypothetical protein ACOYIK_10735 [Coriobacteriales bacterium]